MKEPKTQVFRIKGELTDLNTYIRAERSNKYKAAKIKEEETMRVALEAKASGLKRVDKPVAIIIRWETKNKKKDKDNIAFAKKFILDGLVKAGVLKDDGWEQVEYFLDFFGVDKNNPGVMVAITPMKENKKYPLTK